MAGSWKGIVNQDGKFIGVALLDNLGDAYEALEECYGMIHYLAKFISEEGTGGLGAPNKEIVAYAHEHYKDGLRFSPGIATEEEIDQLD